MKTKESKTFDLISDTLNQMGVSLVKFEILDVPTYYVKVNQSQLLDKFETVMTSVYWILWTLTYGKHQDSDTRKIDLKYEEVKSK